jgi:hypothetical protein
LLHLEILVRRRMRDFAPRSANAAMVQPSCYSNALLDEWTTVGLTN